MGDKDSPEQIVSEIKMETELVNESHCANKDSHENVIDLSCNDSDLRSNENNSQNGSNGEHLKVFSCKKDIEHFGDTESFEIIKIKILYKKEKHDLSIINSSTIKELKYEISKLTGLHTTLQKIMFKGPVKETQTLKELGATDGSKFMVIGSTIDDILSIRPPDKTQNPIAEPIEINSDNKLGKQRIHIKVLEKGKPEDAMIGIKNIKLVVWLVQEPLPIDPLTGMLERGGGKLRLTFKLELDQLWIGTKDRTQKIPLNSIVAIVSEAIEDHEEYHIMGIQLGPTEASRYWIYWVPAQYIESIKKAIFG